MCENWGYDRLAEKIRDESIDEMKHAELLIDRILYLEGVPNLQRLVPAADRRDGARAVRDWTSRSSAPPSSASTGASPWPSSAATTAPASCWPTSSTAEEEHADWLETQLEAIRQIGTERYLGHQLHA